MNASGSSAACSHPSIEFASIKRPNHANFSEYYPAAWVSNEGARSWKNALQRRSPADRGFSLAFPCFRIASRPLGGSATVHRGHSRRNAKTAAFFNERHPPFDTHAACRRPVGTVGIGMRREMDCHPIGYCLDSAPNNSRSEPSERVYCTDNQYSRNGHGRTLCRREAGADAG